MKTMHNPPHLGEFIREVYLEPFGVSSRQLASSLGNAGHVRPLDSPQYDQTRCTPSSGFRSSLTVIARQ